MVERYFIFVDPIENHNKFYKARKNDDDSIDVEFGRVGEKAQTHHYAPGERNFESLCDSKERKGYVEKTSEHQVSVTVQSSSFDPSKYQPLPYADMQALIDKFLIKSRQFMKANYTVKLADVTQAMIDDASAHLDNLRAMRDRYQNNPSAVLSDPYAVKEFNRELVALYAAVPRAMKNVKDYLADTAVSFDKLCREEENNLLTLSGMVQTNQMIQQATSPAAQKGTIVDAFGLSMRDVTFDEEDAVLLQMSVKNNKGSSCAHAYIRSYRVENQKTEGAFQAFCKDHGFSLANNKCQLLFHGTGEENLWSVMANGLHVNPPQGVKITGKAFGNGIYFAECSYKSRGYTSVNGSYWKHGDQPTGFLLVYEVAVGNKVDPHQVRSGLSWKSLQSQGYHSVYSTHDFINTEQVVYRDDQCTLRYVVEFNERDFRENLRIKDKVNMRFTDALSPWKVYEAKNGGYGYRTSIDLTSINAATRHALQKITDTSLYPEGATLLFRSDENGISLRYGPDDVFSSAATTYDKQWVARTVMREFAQTKREFLENVKQKGLALAKEREDSER